MYNILIIHVFLQVQDFYSVYQKQFFTMHKNWGIFKLQLKFIEKIQFNLVFVEAYNTNFFS